MQKKSLTDLNFPFDGPWLCVDRRETWGEVGADMQNMYDRLSAFKSNVSCLTHSEISI